jgi:O-antigen ligase
MTAVSRWAGSVCFGLLLVLLAWAPFPLGSNREWSWSILLLGIAGCWLLWVVYVMASPSRLAPRQGRLALVLAMLVLVWAVLQALPVLPPDWAHPLWPQTAQLLNVPLPATVSLNPWNSLAEAAKLLGYVAAAWMVFSLARDPQRAARLLDMFIAIGAAYAAYAFALRLLHVQQFALFYPVSPPANMLAGPFVHRNSFAAFEGLAGLAAMARLVERAQARIVASRGARRMAMSGLQFLFGSGVLLIIAAVLTLSAVLATASRGAAAATFCGLAVMGLLGLFTSGRSVRKSVAIAGVAVLLLVLVVWISGDGLGGRMDELVDAGGADEIRIALWAAAKRMIASAPWLGLGLGSFIDAYPIYADHTWPYIMDKAHNDYLEFAAGVGLPAAICWWSAWALAAGRMLLGVFQRRRNKVYPLVGLGAVTLVAVQSAVDFSLQMPAVAFACACLLGLGLAQAYPGQRSAAG